MHVRELKYRFWSVRSLFMGRGVRDLRNCCGILQTSPDLAYALLIQRTSSIQQLKNFHPTVPVWAHFDTNHDTKITFQYIFLYKYKGGEIFHFFLVENC